MSDNDSNQNKTKGQGLIARTIGALDEKIVTLRHRRYR